MNIRTIAASVVACTLALGSAATAVAVPGGQPEPVLSATADDHRLVEIPEDHAHLAGRDVSMRAMYKRAGLGTPLSQRAAAKTTAPQPASALNAEASATTTTSGNVLLYGMRDHVDNLCVGTGTDGTRVELLYVREVDQPDRYLNAAPLIRREARLMDDTMALSAKKTDGGRRIRYVTDSNCQIVVRNVVLPDGAISNSTGITRNHLIAAGYNVTDRRYLVFADVPMGGMTGGACGSALNYNVSSKTDNPNDSTDPQYARVDLECWNATTSGGSIALHELMHTFGAVFTDAPNSNKYGHCVDDADLMCYATGMTDAPPMRQDCPATDEVLLDCGNDDYFHTNPAAGSYLSTHWNLADSRFLAAVPPIADPPALTLGLNGTTDTKDIGQNHTFTATVEPGSTVTWKHDVPDCQIPTGTSTGTTFTLRCWDQAAPTVTATVSNPNTLFTTSDSIQVFYNHVPNDLTLTRPLNAQINTGYQVSAAVSGPGTWTYQWETVDSPGCALTSATTPRATVTCNGTMTGRSAAVRTTATRTEDGEQLVGTAYTSIVDSRAPVVTITGPTAVAPGATATFTSQVSNTDNPTYAWTSSSAWGTGATTGTTFTVQPPSTLHSGSDMVTLTVRGSNGRSTIVNATYSVESALAATLVGPASVVSGQTAAYEVTANKTVTVTWADNSGECDLAPDSQDSQIARLTCLSTFDGTVAVTATTVSSTGERVTRVRNTTVAPYRVPTALTIQNITHPDRVVVTLKNKADGSRLPGYRVVLERRGDATDFAPLRAVTTNSLGQAVFNVESPEVYLYRATVTGQAPLADVTSGEQVVLAANSLRQQKVRGGLRATLKDFHGVGIDSANLVLMAKPKGARNFKTVKFVTTNHRGAFTFKVNPRKPTTYRWNYRSVGYYRAAVSNTIRLR